MFFKGNGAYIKALTTEGNTYIPNEGLPLEVITYIEGNYGDSTIGHSFKTNVNTLQVFLSDGTVTYFTGDGQFLEDSNGNTGTGDGNGDETDNGEGTGDGSENGENNPTPIAINELPANIIKYAEIYFPMYEIGKAYKNTTGFQVYLQNQLQLNFNTGGEWISNDLSNAPNSIISKLIDFEALPYAAFKYVKNNYSNATPNYTFKQSNEQFRVHLSNNLILYFDGQGEVLEIIEGWFP